MSTFNNTINMESYKILIKNLSDKEKEEFEKGIKDFLDKFDIVKEALAKKLKTT